MKRLLLASAALLLLAGCGAAKPAQDDFSKTKGAKAEVREPPADLAPTTPSTAPPRQAPPLPKSGDPKDQPN